MNEIAFVCNNNLIEIGASGEGINLDANRVKAMVVNNAVYGSGTKYTIDYTHFESANESLSITPFAKSGSDTFANRFAYFAPVDTGSVRGGAFMESNLDKGAVQHADTGGGGGPAGYPVSRLIGV